MRTLLLAGLSAAALLASTLAFADDAKPVTPTPAAANNADKPICQPVTHEGMLVGKTCHTQKEWDRIHFQSQQEVHQYQQQSLFGTGH